jgi:uncharacterized protein
VRYHGINIPTDAIAELCRRNGVARLSLFGSILTERFDLDSDIDVLVEFLPQTRIGYLGMSRMEEELSRMLGRRVDLRTPAELSRYFRDEVVRAAKVQYAA